jgi:uncharacterized protein
MTENNPAIVRVQNPPYTASYAWSVGVPMEKFIKALAEKKLLASKCPHCGYGYVPPRNRCGKCATEMGEGDIIEISGKGKLVSYTAGHVELDGAGNWKELETPRIIGAAKLDGADSMMFLPVEWISQKDLKPGLPVKVLWSKETKGAIGDIKGLGPA